MINKQTILSLYNDKLTLMQWLKSVEVALKDATAKEFVVNKKGEATISFSILFDDGTTLESGDIILQQGESVASARISSGHLILTLTNGVDLDAGNLGAVSSFSINESQHLIVHYQDGSTNDLGAIFSGNISVDGNLTASGTIDGASVTGDEIVEKMSGYSFYQEAKEGITLNPVYCGVVKNGNKLTFVIFGKATRTGDVANDFAPFGFFIIPDIVANKLYPTPLGSQTNAILSKTIQLFSSTNSKVDCNIVVNKVTYPSQNRVQTYVYGMSNLTLNTEYQYRIEMTFLLSNNLAS